jgi:hypothetical protein
MPKSAMGAGHLDFDQINVDSWHALPLSTPSNEK